MQIDDLIERLEKAEGPSRELDAYIYCATHAGVSMLDVECRRVSAPAYTASIDAALTLVPEGWSWAVIGTGLCELMVYKLHLKKFIRGTSEATPAIAIVIASLKAIREEGQQ